MVGVLRAPPLRPEDRGRGDPRAPAHPRSRARRGLGQMSEPLQFFVAGRPRAQGSKRHVGGGRMIESSADLPAWRELVAARAREEADGRLFATATRVRAVFWFPPLRSHYGTGRNAGTLKASAPHWKETKPDADKLVRALLDGLVIGGVLRDDALVARLEVEKRYGDVGVLVELSELAWPE